MQVCQGVCILGVIITTPKIPLLVLHEVCQGVCKRCCYNKVRYTVYCMKYVKVFKSYCYNKVRYHSHSVLHEVCQGVVKGVVIIKYYTHTQCIDMKYVKEWS